MNNARFGQAQALEGLGELQYREAPPKRKPEAIRVYADGRVEEVAEFAGGLYDILEEKCATCGKVERRRKFRVEMASGHQDPAMSTGNCIFVLIEVPA